MKLGAYSLLSSIIFSIFTLSSCLTSPPPKLVINNGDEELLIKGERETPEKNVEEVLYSLPQEIIENGQNDLVKIKFPLDYSGYIDFYLSDGSRERMNSPLLPFTSGPAILTLTSFTLGDIEGIGLPAEPEKAIPVIEVEAKALDYRIEKNRHVEGMVIDNPDSGIWNVEIDSAGWSRSITANPWNIRLDYSMVSDSGTVGPMDNSTVSSLSLIKGDGTREDFDFYPKSGSHNIYFYSEQYQDIPKEINISTDRNFELSSIAIDLRKDEKGRGVPILADTGTILHYPREKWRNPEYEYFRWNLYPEVVQIITDSYTTQSRFFKRLAFFVEKPGFVGRLAPNEEIESLHGWNAHDYCPEDLAVFFQQAKNEKFRLNPEENLLEEILLECGVISDLDGKIRPGSGALVGTSIETFYEQRLIFMVHESFHGIYFTPPEYRKECEAFWESLSLKEQNFWKTFLLYRNYNVNEDRDLLINETVTYLLQQPAGQADDYFVGFITPRLLKSRPDLEEWFVPFLLDNPGLFARQVKAMEERLYRLEGFTASTVHDLLPRNRSRKVIFEGLEQKWLDEQSS